MIVGGRIAAHDAASVRPEEVSVEHAGSVGLLGDVLRGSRRACTLRANLERLVIGYRHPGQVDEASAETLDLWTGKSQAPDFRSRAA